MDFRINGLLTIDNVLKNVSPLDIYRRYSNFFVKVGVHFKADFRDDPKPSAIIYRRGDTYLYKDFGEDGALNCFQFVQRKFGLTFKEALDKINIDFNLYLGGSIGGSQVVSKTTQFNKEEEFKTIIEVKKRDYNDNDLIWWGNQGWDLDCLKKANISPISYFRLTSERKNIDQKLYICDDSSYTIDYYVSKNIFRRKIYQPKNKNFKWLSNTDKTVTQGIKTLPRNGNILFISSSIKDCIQTHNIYGGYNSIAPNSESSFIIDSVFYELKSRFKQIVLWFDSDKTGIEKSKKFSAIYKIPYITNPLYCNCPKDQSDLWRDVGGSGFRRIMLQELNKKNINSFL